MNPTDYESFFKTMLNQSQDDQANVMGKLKNATGITDTEVAEKRSIGDYLKENKNAIGGVAQDLAGSLGDVMATKALAEKENFSSESEMKANAKGVEGMSMKTGMQLGGTVGSLFGPVGKGAGMLLGATGGYLYGAHKGNQMENDYFAKAEEDHQAKLQEQEKERKLNFYNNMKTSELEKYYSLMKGQVGLIG